MNIVAHIVFPIASAQLANVYRAHSSKSLLFNWKHLLIIGLCGGLPDILSPHTGLTDRYNSFTHSISFLFLGLLITILLAWKYRPLRGLVYCCYFAAALHLFCDMIAGGINLYAPFGRMIVGQHYVPFRYWIGLDIAAILFCLVPPLHNRSSDRAKTAVFAGGYALAVLGSALAISTLDSEKVILKHTPASEMDSAQIERAKLVWNTLYDKWKSGAFEIVSEDYNDDMRKALSPQLQEQIFNQFESSYGHCQGITFVEAITGRFGFPQTHIYRFRGSFSRTTEEPEIGVVFDSKGKVSGFRFSKTFSRSLL